MRFKTSALLLAFAACPAQDPDIVNVTVNNYACCDAGDCDDDEPDAGPAADAGADDDYKVAVSKVHNGPLCEAYQVRTREDRANLYIVLDRSSSMNGLDQSGSTRMVRALLGIDEIAQSYAARANLGLSTYPCSPTGQNIMTHANRASTWAGEAPVTQGLCMSLNQELLAMGQHSVGGVTNSYQNPGQDICDFNATPTIITDDNNAIIDTYDLGWEDSDRNLTPTGAALYDVIDRDAACDQNSAVPCNQQHRNVVLITDGQPIGCGDGSGGAAAPQVNAATATAASALLAQGIPTYVVGFAGVSQAGLDVMATAGGTDQGTGGPGPLTADNPATLALAFDDIVDAVRCSMRLDNPPNPLLANETLVNVGGVAVAQDATNGYTYNAQTQSIYLHGTACQQLVDNDADFEVWTGCEGGVDRQYTEVTAGDYFQYEINVNITGSNPGGRIVVTDALPPCLQVVAMPTSGWYCSLSNTPAGQLVTCEADADPAPGPLTLTVRATGRCGERIRNCASASLGAENARDCDDVDFVERRTREP
jgi:hypothetical protein